MQNGGGTQDDRQSIKFSRYVKTAPKNFNLWNLVIRLYLKNKKKKKIQNGRTIQDVATHYIFLLFDFSTDQIAVDY
jgi:hypothetical protein